MSSWWSSLFEPATEEETVLVRSKEYKNYKSRVALKQVEFMTPSGARRTWYYADYRGDFGASSDKKDTDKDDDTKQNEEGPLVMLGGVCCTTDTFFRQFVGLCPRGHRLVAVQPTGDFDDVNDWIDAFSGFLDKLRVDRVHLFGSQLGGYLAMRFVAARPSKVFSLILCNAFCDTEPFITNSRMFSKITFKALPDVIVKHWALSQLPETMLSTAVADSVDFVVHEIEQTPGNDLITKAKLILEPGHIEALSPDHPLLTRGGGKCVTVIMSDDAHSGSFELREEVLKFFPESRVTVLRDGGDFPYLSMPDDVNMFIEVHLRFAESCAQKGDPYEDQSEGAEESSSAAAAVSSSPPPAADASGDQE